jgi:molybdopterin-guanine dinucleotide biosynthesis protein A
MKPDPDALPEMFEAVILAGGLSTRMGVDKSRVLLNRRGMLSIIRGTASQLDLPVRVIRKDAVPRCGPLGGIMTALSTTRTQAVLFLACDMPLVSTALLRRLLRASRSGACPVFSVQQNRIGFPLVLPHAGLACVGAQIARRAFSVQGLAEALKAKTVRVAGNSPELLNVNTPGEKIEAERWLQSARRRVKK